MCNSNLNLLLSRLFNRCLITELFLYILKVLICCKLVYVGLGIGSACNDTKGISCLNGGTCKVINKVLSFCLCPNGYYGLRCEKNKSMCSSKSIALLDGKYRNLQTFDGSITVWFCDIEFVPFQGFAVCQNDKWSIDLTCTKSNNFNLLVIDFLNRHYWKILVLLIVMCIGQIYFPCQIFCCKIIYRAASSVGYKESQARDKEQIITQFKKELAAFENIYPCNGSSHIEYSEQASAALADIQQRLENSVDLLKTKQRKNKLNRKGAVKGCGRLTSGYNSFTIWFWVAYLILSSGYDLKHYSYTFYLFNAFAITWIVLLTLFIFIESCASSDRKYIGKLAPIASTKNRLEKILATPPAITMVAECYHYETVTMDDESEREDKVISATIKNPFVFHYWRNQSSSTLLDLHKKKVTKIKVQLDINFGDAETENQFQKCYANFQELNRNRDEHVEFSIFRQVPGFEKRMTTFDDLKPGWMNYKCFFLSTFLCVGWLYRAVFNRVTGNTEYQMKKLIFTNRPVFSDALRYDHVQSNTTTAAGGINFSHQQMKINENEAAESLLPSPPAYDTLYSVDNIREILNSLEKENNDDSDNAPLKLANNSEYIDVRLETTDEVHQV